MHGENEPRRLSSWCVFRDVLHGPPTFWVPPCVYPSPIPPRANMSRPHPFGRGAAALVSSLLRTNKLALCPHPSIEGRGS